MSLNKVQWGAYPSSCNWWCRRKHDLMDLRDSVIGSAVLSVVPFSTTIINGVISSLDTIDGNGKVLDVQMTISEESITDKWSKEQFSPYLLGLASKIEVLKNQPTYSINDTYLISLLLGEICVVVHYYSNYENPLLSPQVNNVLSAYVYECLQPMRNELLKLVPAKAEKYTVKYDYVGLPKPLIESGQIQNKKFICEIFIPKGVIPNSIEDIPDAIALTESDIYFNTVPKTDVSTTTQNTNTSSSSTNANPMNAELEPKPQTQTQTQTQENQASTPPKSSSNILGWLLAAFIGYKILK